MRRKQKQKNFTTNTGLFLGKAPPPLFPIPPEEADTPRTYRSNPDADKEKKEEEKAVSPGRKGKNKKKFYSSPNDELSQEEAITAMKQSMKYFTRAVVSGKFMYFYEENLASDRF